MYKFLMVSTVFSKKQFAFISCEENEDFMKFLKDETKRRSNLVLYPVMTYEDIRNVSDLLSEKECKALRRDSKDINPFKKKFAVKNFTGFMLPINRIEHIAFDMFRFCTEHGNFISNSVQPIMMGKTEEHR